MAKSMAKERQKIRKSMERQLNQNLLKILNIINDYKEHIPSITTTEGNPFPYQVESVPDINVCIAVFCIYHYLLNVPNHT
jgi:midasin (ATPase involved in ribosome maturation)